MALKLSLKPGEKIAINGAVIVNGDRRSTFSVENKASVLRESDIMQPEEATTPAARIYLPIMMMYMDESIRTQCQPEYERRLTEFSAAIISAEPLAICAELNAYVANGDYYKALSACRKLMEFEKTRLENVA